MAFDPSLADRLRSALARRTSFVERKMFGGLSFMVNGHMCCGVTGSDLVLRLGPDQVRAVLGKPNTRPMDFTGKPMKSMVYVDVQGTTSDEELDAWVEIAVAFARTQPG